MARGLAAAGARIVIAARSADKSEAALAELRAMGPESLALTVDVAEERSVAALFDAAVARCGRLDILVNNAGIAGPTAKVEDVSIEDWNRCIDIDLNGMFYCTRLAMPMLKAAGGGSIINLSSAAGRLGFPLRSAYAAAKWGVVGFTKSVAMEAGQDKVRVNAIQPGVVEGERINRVIEAKAKAANISFEVQKQLSLEKVSMRSMVSPQDIANMALYLASDAGHLVTGQAISVCAGTEMLA
jgi:NAD(P)-dependent dehydrogenase (short-subunit alcohol dehydrogenase family)